MNADFYGGMGSHQPIPENQDFAGVMIRYNRGTIPPASHTEGTFFKKEPGNIDDNDLQAVWKARRIPWLILIEPLMILMDR